MATRSSNATKDDAKQQKLFASSERSRAADELLVMRALGDFQRRGKVLADRPLPIDRLRGALRRQAESAGAPELTDERFAEILGDLGARVQRVPAFVAKHPFRVVVPASLAERARQSFDDAESESAG